MAQFNPDFWELPAPRAFFEGQANENGIWFETHEDRECRYAKDDFCAEVMPIIRVFIEEKLTARQRDIVRLHFLNGLTQDAIALQLGITQSTVSRHLHGTVRDGHHVGGALRKLRNLVAHSAQAPLIEAALCHLHEKWRRLRAA